MLNKNGMSGADMYPQGYSSLQTNDNDVQGKGFEPMDLFAQKHEIKQCQCLFAHHIKVSFLDSSFYRRQIK